MAALTVTQIRKLVDIHERVKKGFRYVDDKRQFGVDEWWHLAPDVNHVRGDCDDFAIACRYLIKQEMDIPTRLIVCVTETSEWHLVCSAGDYLLDNRQRSGEIRTKEELERGGYEFKYMSGLNPGDPWYKIKE